MKEGGILFFILSIALGGIAYFCTQSFLIAIPVGLLFLLLFFFIVLPSVASYTKRQRIRHECYVFVNAFLITLSVCQSLDKSYELSTQSAEKEFKQTIDAIGHLEAKERVDYLSSYFKMPIYDMFLSLLNLYIEQGGDILKLSKTLMEELTRIEETENSLQKHGINALIQWIILWAMSLAILAFVRFGLDSFYTYLKNSTSYLIMILVYFLFLAISILVFTYKYTGFATFLRKPKKKERRMKREKAKG